MNLSHILFELFFLQVEQLCDEVFSTFSYNSYYFGDPFTDYVKEVPSIAPGFERDRLSIFQFDSDRFEWIKFYAVPVIPDIVLPDSLKSNLLTDEHSRASESPTENWVGFLSISIMIIALIFSFYYKNKRSEILIFVLIIVILWLFYSSSFLNIGNYEESSTWLSTRDRYMIPVIPLSFILIGFIIHQLWITTKIFFKNHSSILFIIVKSIFLLGVIIISILSLNESLPIQNIQNSNFVFKDPEFFINNYPENWLYEKLTKHTIVVRTFAIRTVDADAISFFPIWGYYPLNIVGIWDPDLLPQEPIQRLKDLLSEQKINEDYRMSVINFTGSVDLTGINYNIVVPKLQSHFESKYFRYLENNHGFILKDYSNGYCKMELKNADEEISSDVVCYRY